MLVIQALNHRMYLPTSGIPCPVCGHISETTVFEENGRTFILHRNQNLTYCEISK